MSGHSKWSTIKHKKAANDAVKSGVFTKIAGLITIATKKGGSGDPDKNFSLRLAIEKARAVNMPKEKIEKAIEKGLGKGGDELTELVIEGYGPEGVAVVVTALTDSRNRTVAEIKNLMEKNGGRMGEPGSVMYQFDRVGLIVTSKTVSDDDELTLIDKGILDVANHESGAQIATMVEDLQKITEVLNQMQYPEINGEIGYKPKALSAPNNIEVVEEYLSLLSLHNDVQEVYANI